MGYLVELGEESRKRLLPYDPDGGFHPVCGPCPLNPCRIQAEIYEL